jgi:Endonuclease/Exonuclease/phosphatase family
MNRLLTAVAAALLLAGCDRHPTSPAVSHTPTLDAVASGGSAAGVAALTWNVYIGADLGHVLAAQTADQAVQFATEEWANVRSTDFPARAGALAAAIARRRPHLVGLEEVALYRTTTRPFEELASDVAYDFLQLVIDSLQARGAPYTVAAVDHTSDIPVPVISGVDANGQPTLAGVRFTDGDAVLVRSDVSYRHAQSGLYDAYVPVTLGGVASGLYQGWSSVDAALGGRTYHFVVTHLAGQEVPEVQHAQAEELLGLLAGQSGPVLVAGDFNSDAYGADPTRATPTYGMLVDAGYVDSWAAPDRQAPGLTCCQAKDLRNGFPAFDQRIDFIFTRHLAAAPPPVDRAVIGDRPGDRTADGLWPSDHAGLAATFAAH